MTFDLNRFLAHYAQIVGYLLLYARGRWIWSRAYARAHIEIGNHSQRAAMGFELD